MKLVTLILFGAYAGLALCSPIDLDKSAIIEAVPVDEESDYRLTDDVLPMHYDLKITPYFEKEENMEEFQFLGKAVVTIKPTKDVNSVVLHMQELTIGSWYITDDNNLLVEHLDEKYDPLTTKLTLPLKDGVFLKNNTEYRIVFTYIGKMANDMHGFYRTYYVENGTKVWMASTQFQPFHARRAFPCFDEPRFKATFKLTIVRNSKYQTFSNTPATTVPESTPGLFADMYEMTPVMSTYLLAFIVAPYSETLNADKTFGILARPEAKNQTDYSLVEGQKILTALEGWTDYKYNKVPEMKKMHMAAIPEFSAGAMENWGLLTYREANILYVASEATLLQQQRIAAVITHEIAHQWFGDLVTCDWWDVTWLNEGFARYFQYFGTHLVEGNWDLLDQFVVEQLQGVFQLDSTDATHPMSDIGKVNQKAHITKMFDNISYNKGGSILRMLEHFMGSDAFKLALRKYIVDREYKAANPTHLFAQIGAEATDFITKWTTQSGYPLVTVKTETDGYTLSQKRFMINNKDHTDASLWPVPITFATKAAEFETTKPSKVMTEKDMKITEVVNATYMILNNQQTGYYRVNYDAAGWEKISKALNSDNFDGIHVLNRAQIVDDLYNLARGDIIKYGDALNILEYMKKETEYAPWLAAFNGLSYLERRSDDLSMFADHVKDILTKPYELLKFQKPVEGEKRVTSYNRINVLQWACKYDIKDCISQAKKEFDNMYTSKEGYNVHPDLRQVVYCTGLREGKVEHFDFLWKRYVTHNVATEKNLLLQGMACTKDETAVKNYLGELLKDDIRPQDKNSTFTSIYSSNDENVDFALDYVTANFKEWATVFGGHEALASSLSGLASRFRTEEQKTKLAKFLETNKETLGGEATKIIERGLAEYETNKKWTENHSDDLNSFFKKKRNSATSVICSVSLTVFSLALSYILNY